MVQAFGLYNIWIGGECNSLGYLLFFTFLPILAALPYGCSCQQELKEGYDKIVEVPTGRAKYLAVFLAGGSCIAMPLIGNFILTACFVPAVKPTNFNLPQWGQPYMVPPKAGLLQSIILSTFSITESRGCKV